MSLADHLGRQRQRLEQLLELLNQERQALSQGQVDGERLAQLAEDKQAHFAELERFETQRREAQRRLGYGDHAQGAERAAEDADCLALWQALQDKAGRAAHLNRLNGVLIHQRLAHNQRMLGFLRERVGNSLYGPDGQSLRRGTSLSSRA